MSTLCSIIESGLVTEPHQALLPAVMLAVKGRVTRPVCWTACTFMWYIGGRLEGNLNTSTCLLSLRAVWDVVKQNLLSSSCLAIKICLNMTLTLLCNDLKSLQNSILCSSEEISIEAFGTSSKVKVVV